MKKLLLQDKINHAYKKMKDAYNNYYMLKVEHELLLREQYWEEQDEKTISNSD